MGYNPKEYPIYNWAVLSDEQMSNGWPYSLLNDEQMRNKVRVEQQPDKYFTTHWSVHFLPTNDIQVIGLSGIIDLL